MLPGRRGAIPGRRAGGHDDPAREGQSSGPARGNRDHPATSGNEPLTGLTMNEIRRMHAICPARPATTCTGHAGGAATKPAPAGATTSEDAPDADNPATLGG